MIPKLAVIQQNYLNNDWYALTRHLLLYPKDDAVQFYSLHCIGRMDIPVDKYVRG